MENPLALVQGNQTAKLLPATPLQSSDDDSTCPNEEESAKFIEELKKEKSLVPAKTNLGAASFFTHKNNQKLAYCVNLKSGYTLLTLIFGYLSDDRLCNINLKWTDKLVQKCNRVKTKRNTVHRVKAERQNWTVLNIIRDPINRFISGWLDRCVHRTWGKKDKRKDYCSKCGKDIACFVNTHYEKLLGYTNGTNKLAATFDNGHFWPQTWICPLRPKLKTELMKLGRSEKFLQNLERVLAENKGVTQEKLGHIMDAVRGKKTTHTRFGGPEWQNVVDTMRHNPSIYRTLLKMYYSDYEHFGIFKLHSTFDCWLKHNEEIVK